MIKISIKKQSGIITAFSCKGHADYEDEGKDIVCASVSAITINAVNSVEAFTKDKFRCEQSDGCLDFRFEEHPTPESQLIMQSMLLGLQNIEKEVGSRYVKVTVVDC